MRGWRFVGSIDVDGVAKPLSGLKIVELGETSFRVLMRTASTRRSVRSVAMHLG